MPMNGSLNLNPGHDHDNENHSRNNRLHPRSPRNRVGQGDGNLNSNNVEPTFAALTLTLSDLLYILKGYITRGLKHIRRTGPKMLRNVSLIIGILVVLFMSMMMVIVIRFVQNEIRPLCSKPPNELDLNINNVNMDLGGGSTHKMNNSNNGNDNDLPPLVEYYVHGRGNGHYARSVAIVEQLLNKGVDVRMFIGRATMWRAVNEARRDQKKRTGNSEEEESFITTQPGQRRGEVTVTSIHSLLPTMGLFDTISLVIERILSDCSIAKSTNRYPDLVISDGDLPGMLRAKYGSLPSVSVAHGQIFVIGQKPEWVKNNDKMNKAWNKQSRLNAMASWYSDWVIGTNFMDLPVQEGNGVVARSPMRPEVMKMGRERQRRTHQSLHVDMNADSSNNGGVDVLRDGTHTGGGVHVKDTFMAPWQKDAIDELLVGEDITASLEVTRNAVQTKQMKPLNDDELKMTRRKLVICYFRDKNGDLLTKALLRSGFDVILFERGFHKGLSDLEEKKYGQDLIVHRDRQVHHGSSGEQQNDNVSLMDYWSTILRRYDRRLLVDDDEVSDRDLNSNQEEEKKYLYAPKEEASIELRHALRNLNTLFKPNEDTAPRIIRVTDMSLFVPLLSIADGVASSAGSQLLSECIYSHLPVLALHREDDDEQMLNIAFSKHRHDRLSKDKQAGNEKMGHYATENVVHGMSLEKFEKLQLIISMHDDNKSTGSSGGKSHGVANANDEFDMLLSESEQAILLRTKDQKEVYEEFKTFVEAVKSSPISWSYYHDLFHGIVDSRSSINSSASSSEGNVIDSGGEGVTDGTMPSVKNDKKEKETKNESSPEGTVEDDEKYIDPFQGMPEVARVILEILDDLTKNGK